MFQVVTSGNPTPTWPKKEKVSPAWIEKQATIVRGTVKKRKVMEERGSGSCGSY